MRSHMNIIAHIRSPFTEKFGIPRQSGLTGLQSQIVFEPPYRVADAFRGLEGYSHIWILWQFSEAIRQDWSPTVRPPRLGGNTRMGVFATRSPFRPNPIGLSSVRLEKIELHTPDGPILHVSGADLMDGTPIYDIKPYLAYTDAHPEALGGFALQQKEGLLEVEFPDACRAAVPEHLQAGLVEILSQDPRPQYQNDPTRVYTMSFGGMEVSFTVEGTILRVCGVK
ncbi:MAG: tRNA (N6-threonylcarbamoyladenosine(37)-N6)-methyltransferase TrmO [Ruminococcus sp.]|nr:tRNA (N6-threonylcarbamoyladenosine(37)-N6)-methyltransferase TrmO [Ruminococcus sp.]